MFYEPELLRPEAAQARVTEHAASEFAKLADSLEQRGIDPERAAHFLMRLLFCLFADSIGLLPDHLFRQMIELDKGRPANFARKLRQLFAAMSTSGSTFGPHDIHYFNGGLFADDEVFELTSADMGVLRAAAALDWSQVEPAIFGTSVRAQLGPRQALAAWRALHQPGRYSAHCGAGSDRASAARWAAVKAEATALAEAAENEKGLREAAQD